MSNLFRDDDLECPSWIFSFYKIIRTERKKYNLKIKVNFNNIKSNEIIVK